MSTAALEWTAANQRYLLTALEPVRAALERRVGGEAPGGPQEASLRELSEAMPAPPAIERLCGALRLSRFERSLLLLCAGVELDSGFAALCAAASGTGGAGPTFSLALAILPDAHWSALAPAGPLRRWRLIDLTRGDALTTTALRIDERVLHHLVGVECLDERLEGLVGPALTPSDLPGSQAAFAERVAGIWARSAANGRHAPLVLLLGRDCEARTGVAATAAAAVGMQLRRLHADLIPSAGAEREALRRLCMREGLLSEMALLVDFQRVEDRPAAATAALRFLDELGSAVVVSAKAPPEGLARLSVRVDVPHETASEQRALWLEALGERARELDGRLDELVAHFDLRARGIAAAGLELEEALDSAPAHELASVIWETCRAQARVALDDLAQRIDPRASWDDLVLPPLQDEILREIAASVRHRARVYDAWGFGRKDSRGLGISALFAGPSGTGKTMAAEVLARELRLDLYRIDLSSVVSKYIGETEKNLRRVFDAAEQGGAILLFDEADALFGKRTEVKDSHDRYANIEVSYLLQRMEAYRGLAILTTNFRSALDQAFLRRLRFVVDFPFPGAEQREEIWRRIFPSQTPTDGLDVGRLAQLQVTGGSIRNIALRAAFLAAGEDRHVEMEHLRRAARGEYVKLQRSLTGAELGGWS
jgi:predicted nucleic acid-binding protein